MSVGLRRIRAPNPPIPCGGCHQPITDPCSAHEGGETHALDDGCWKNLTTPGGGWHVTCPSCPSTVNIGPLFSPKEKIKMIFQQMFEITGRVVKTTGRVVELAARVAPEGTVMGLSCVTGIKIGDLAFNLALKSPTIKALLDGAVIILVELVALGVIAGQVTNKKAQLVLSTFSLIGMVLCMLFSSPNSYLKIDAASMIISLLATIAATKGYIVSNANGRNILTSAGLLLLMSGCIEMPTLGNESFFTFSRTFLPFVFSALIGSIAVMQAQPEEGLRIAIFAGFLFGISFFLPDRWSSIENSGNLGVLNNNI